MTTRLEVKFCRMCSRTLPLNRGIGLLGDNPRLLEAAVHYLRRKP